MGKLLLKRLLIICTYFTLGASLNSLAILDNSCGGANIVDATMCDTATIFNYTVDANSLKGICTTESNFVSSFDYLWNATWMNSEREEFSSSPRQFPRLTQFGQKSCLVTFVRSFTFGTKPDNSSSSEFLIDFLDQWEEQNILS